MTTNTTTIGVDIAKNTFHLVFADKHGNQLKKQQLSRNKLKSLITTHSKTKFVIEACGSSHHWARQMQAAGHEAKLINPAFVTPFVMSNKNDYNDASAIITASSQSTMRFVAMKSVDQQTHLMMHRIRERLVQQRTALINQIRGLLAEFGIVLSGGANKVPQELPYALEDAQNELNDLGRKQFKALLDELVELNARLDVQTKAIEDIAKHHPVMSKLIQVPGIGLLTASAIVASTSHAHDFKNGRQFAAWLGLVPKQHSTGGKQTLLGISKRGDRYLRRLLVQGAMAAICCSKREDSQLAWARKLRQEKCLQVASVALANKTARILWSLMANDKAYAVV
jgi:transposase